MVQYCELVVVGGGWGMWGKNLLGRGDGEGK